MYANQHRRGRIDPASLIMATTLSAALIGGLVTSSPTVQHAIQRTLQTYSVPDDPVPPPDPIQHETKAAPHQRTVPIAAPDPLVRTAPSNDAPIVIPLTPPMPPTDGVGTGTGLGTGTVDLPKSAPVLVMPEVDPRYADLLQPPYPAEELRLQREGRVSVRILVGMDGRIRQVERVSATSDAFFRAVERQALGKWRFKPGTRDGIPVEAWRTMSLRFVLDE